MTDVIEHIGRVVRKDVRHGIKNVRHGVRDANKTITKQFNNATKIIHGTLFKRNGFPPDVSKFLERYGEEVVVRMAVNRDPINQAIQKTLNFISGGKVPYDKLFHLSLQCFCASGFSFTIEKNEVIRVGKVRSTQKDGDNMKINEGMNISVNEMVHNTIEHMTSKKFFNYQSNTNNCQNFIIGILRANRILKPEYEEFIKQDTASIFEGNPLLRKFANTLTDMGARADVLMQGGNLKVIGNVRYYKK